MPPRASVGSMGWVKRYKRPWALNAPSHATVTPAACNLPPPPHGTATARAPSGCARLLSSRRSRVGPSLSARTKRPARSDSVCEHRDSRAGGARPAATFRRGGRWQQATRGRGADAQGAGHHRAQRGRIVWNAPAHLARRRACLELAVADAEQHARPLSTTVEFMHNADIFTVSEVSAGLPTCTDAQGCAWHTLSVELAAAPLWCQPRKNGSSRCRLDQDIAATARCRVFDSEGEPGGQR